MNTNSYAYSQESGNVLFIILIAVILFAALSYAVSSSNRGTNSNANKEIGITDASEIIQHANSINVAMQRLRIAEGCDYEAIDFNDAFGNPNDYPGPCNVFDFNNGGALPYNKYPNNTHEIFSDSDDPPYPGKRMAFYNSMRILGIGIDGRSDTVLYYFNIDKNLCQGINDLAGVEGDIMEEDTPYEGGWSNPIISSLSTNQNLTIGNMATNLVGKNFGCYMAARAGTDMGYHIYYVLTEM
jgi:hypothetical protein